MTANFAGDKKIGASILSGPETRLKHWAVPRLPSWLETYHLTLMTVLWSAGNVACGFLARRSLQWLWGVSLLIVLQYLTDLFDGELGRQRRTGLIKWGFYMDHFLDYIFLCSLVFVGYLISPPGLEVWYFVLLVILGGFMVNSFLSFAATNEFEIYRYGVGPTEMRVVFIGINTYITLAGTGALPWLVPGTVAVCLAGLLINCRQIHGKLWRLDMAAKAAAEK
ncbi:MAG: hypothetical protein PHQ27_05435 [Victivallales bacterium]|nr:hypothetical protein [Victivallales bacterium]